MAKGKTGQKPIGFTIDAETHAIWMEAAKIEHRSLAAEIRDAMDERVSKLKIDSAATAGKAETDPLEEL